MRRLEKGEKGITDILIIYEEWSNRFVTTEGFPIINPLYIIKPNELYLFRQDHGACLFRHRARNDILVEITTEE